MPMIKTKIIFWFYIIFVPHSLFGILDNTHIRVYCVLTIIFSFSGSKRVESRHFYDGLIVVQLKQKLESSFLLNDSGKVLDSMHIQDVITWIAIIVGYAQNGKEKDSVRFY